MGVVFEVYRFEWIMYVRVRVIGWDKVIRGGWLLLKLWRRFMEVWCVLYSVIFVFYFVLYDG